MTSLRIFNVALAGIWLRTLVELLYHSSISMNHMHS